MQSVHLASQYVIVTARRLALSIVAVSFISSCSSDNDSTITADSDEPLEFTRDSGMRVYVQSLDNITLHTLTSPESVFANSTHIVETDNSLVVVDSQFLLPNALDVREYADNIGKQIDRVFITHEHPDHFLGGEAFSDKPMFALQEVSDAIATNGQAEIDEKQADFGSEAIAGTFVVPDVVEPGNVVIDGVTFQLDKVLDAEAAVQLVVRLPEHGVVMTGDIVYSFVHLILAGQIPTWTIALQDLASTAEQYPTVLAGHGIPASPSVYNTNIEYLAKAAELLNSVDNSDDFRQGLLDAFPELTMPAAIDFAIPFLFPNE